MMSVMYVLYMVTICLVISTCWREQWNFFIIIHLFFIMCYFILNPQAPDGVYKHITISRASFEQKRGSTVWVIENKWSAYGKTILSRIHS